MINSPTRYFILSAIVFHELRWKELLDDLVAFRRILKKLKGLKMNDEIHATHFVNNPGDLVRIKRNDRLDILKKCIDWTAQHPDISVITVCIDKYGKTTEDIFELAWERLIQRFENTIRYKNFPGPSNPDDRGMVLADNTDSKKLNMLLRKMRRYNTIANKGGLFTNGFRNIPISYIIEDPIMRDSSQSYFHQMVDVIAYCARQLFEPNAFMKKKGANTFYNRLSPVVNKKVAPAHPLGIVMG